MPLPYATARLLDHLRLQQARLNAKILALDVISHELALLANQLEKECQQCLKKT